MGGFHLCLRALALMVVAGMAGSSCSCSDRIVGEPPEGYAEPACLWLIAPRGYRADGSSSAIHDLENQRTGTVCLCLTQEEYDGLGDRLDQAADTAEAGHVRTVAR